jgi:16S rRNA (uracil1498-N3)-methyltransferase
MESVLTDLDFVNQIFKVLRFRVGEQIILFNGSGKNYFYEIRELSKKSVVVSFVRSEDNFDLVKRNIRLFFPMTKSMEKIEFILQKCTEIGVSEFFPLISQRTERRVLEKRDRLSRILKEATEQCGGDKIPLLQEERLLDEEFLKDREEYVPVFAHLKGENFSFEKFRKFQNFNNADLFIGPEGGFSDEEYEKALEKGFIALKLGDRVLRAETACVAISSLFMFV